MNLCAFCHVHKCIPLSKLGLAREGTSELKAESSSTEGWLSVNAPSPIHCSDLGLKSLRPLPVSETIKITKVFM